LLKNKVRKQHHSRAITSIPRSFIRKMVTLKSPPMHHAISHQLISPTKLPKRTSNDIKIRPINPCKSPSEAIFYISK